MILEEYLQNYMFMFNQKHKLYIDSRNEDFIIISTNRRGNIYKNNSNEFIYYIEKNWLSIVMEINLFDLNSHTIKYNKRKLQNKICLRDRNAKALRIYYRKREKEIIKKHLIFAYKCIMGL